MMDALELKLCDIQGRLFELFLSTEYEIESLVKAFMTLKWQLIIWKKFIIKRNKLYYVRKTTLGYKILPLFFILKMVKSFSII